MRFIKQGQTCRRCGEQFRMHHPKIVFSSGSIVGWKVDFKWPRDICSLCAFTDGYEDFAEFVLTKAVGSEED